MPAACSASAPCSFLANTWKSSMIETLLTRPLYEGRRPLKPPAAPHPHGCMLDHFCSSLRRLGSGERSHPVSIEGSSANPIE